MSKLIDHLPTAGRVLLGLAFTTFGANFFLHFLPQPPMHEGAAGYVGALFASHLLVVVKSVEITAGLMLLANRFVPLALALLAPILVGIVHFHATYDPAGLAVPVVLIAIEIALAWAHRDAFAPMLRARATAARTSVPDVALAPEPG